MKALENDRLFKNMTVREYCSWLGIAPGTYNKLNKEDIDSFKISTIRKIIIKTKMDLTQLAPGYKLFKILNK